VSVPGLIDALRRLDDRAGAAVVAAARAVGILAQPTEIRLGSDFAPAHQAAPGYDVAQAMAAYAAFPWVVACLEAKSTDLAGLPIRLRSGRGKDAEVIDDHESLDLLDRPSRGVSGILFRRQIPIDLDLAGNWYGLCLYSGRRVVSIVRMHPERVRIVPDPVDGIGAYEYDHQGGCTRYSPDDVLHIRLPSYEPGPEGLYGQGKIRPLHNDLTTDLRTQLLAATRAKQGRPDVILSPAENEIVWTDEVRRKIKLSYDRMMTEGGAMIVGGSVKVDLPAWTPRDLEFEKVRLMARDATLAAFGVPGTRVGLPNANYATASNDSIIYWQNLQGVASLIDEQLSRVPQKEQRVHRVYHDFARVDALQASRTERLNRALTWNLLGASPAEAAAYEGFEDAPLPDYEEADVGTDVAALPTDAAAVADTALNGAQISSLLEIVAAVSAGTLTADSAVAMILVAFPTISEADARKIVEAAISLPVAVDPDAAKALRRSWLVGMLRKPPTAEHVAIREVFFPTTRGNLALAPEVTRATPVWGARLATLPTTEEDRHALSLSFIERVYDPSQKRIQLATQRFLKGQADRVVAALGKVTLPESKAKAITRALEDDILASIFDTEAEQEAMSEAMRATLRKAIADAFESSAGQITDSLTFDPKRWTIAANKQIGALVKDVSKHTKDRVRSVIANRIATGATIAEMQAELQINPAFSPARALTIARTETTRSVAAGTQEAYKAAEAEGITVKKQWLSARDGEVRPEHAILDKHAPIAVDAEFKVGGYSAMGPGQFGEPGLDINCRCTTIPEVSGD